jgi:ABC-type multidrug transport system ATPase subunit
VAALLKLDAVSLCYQRGRRSIQVLHDVALALAPGELAGVWGRRGVGKTTLAHVAAGVLSPDSGSVLLDGEPLTDETRRSRRGVLHAQVGLETRRGPEIHEMAVEDWIASRS